MKGVNLREIFATNNIEQPSADLADRIVLYILRVTGIITSLKLIAVLPIYYYNPLTFAFATLSLVVTIVLTFYFYFSATKSRPILLVCLMLYSFYVISMMFYSDFKMNIISIQHMFLIIMIAFYGLNRVKGISFAILFVGAVSTFILRHKSDMGSFTLFPTDFPLPNLVFIVTANFLLVCFIHYYYNLSLSKTLKEINSLNKKLNESVNAKSEFLSTMSHELRTPLNSVIGTAYLLSNSDMNEEQRNNLHNLKFSAESILVLINDILDYSKMDSNNTRLESIPFQLSSHVKNIFHGFEPRANEKELNFSLLIDPSLAQLYVLGDPGRFSQIIYNLLGNAIKFTEVGGVSVTLKELKRADDWVTLLFCIQDTGIGIDEEEIDKLFQPFTQAHSSINRKYGGTGLGLTIVQHLVRLHGGRLELTSKLGFGTKVEVEIQYEIAPSTRIIHAKNADDANQANRDSIIFEDNLSDLKVLLAEDNELAVLFMKQLLKKWNIEPFIARDGQEALNLYENNPIDLILMDIHMPLLDGREATQKIREHAWERSREVYIIALTASVSDTFGDKYKEAGFDDYLKKPFRPNDLLSKIHDGYKALR